MDMKKVWDTHAMQFYLCVKKNEIMLFSGKMMKPEITLLSEINHT